MTITDQAQAILLLTAHLGKPDRNDHRPLSPVEWGRFAQWLLHRGIVPETLLREDPEAVLAGWIDRTITLDRIRYLLGRAGALGLSMERWERAGLWVVTRSDPDYPARLKRRLRTESPPFLFGCGDRRVLNRGGLAVVGSREAVDEDLAFSSRLGAAAALEHVAVISGGARGVDETAMLGALELDGDVVGMLADSLLRSATSSKYRRGLMSGNLALISPFNPEAGFDVGNAMARNKYIYCLADAAVVVATGAGKGGTWNGAVENLKNGWVPLWVRPSQGANAGNAALVQRGARWLPDGELRLASLFDPAGTPKGVEQRGLFDTEPAIQEASSDIAATSVAEPATGYEAGAGATTETDPGPSMAEDLSLYAPFLDRLKRLTAEKPATAEQLALALGIQKAQLGEWLSRAVDEGRVKKLSRPVRYIWAPGGTGQPTPFRSERR